MARRAFKGGGGGGAGSLGWLSQDSQVAVHGPQKLAGSNWQASPVLDGKLVIFESAPSCAAILLVCKSDGVLHHMIYESMTRA